MESKANKRVHWGSMQIFRGDDSVIERFICRQKLAISYFPSEWTLNRLKASSGCQSTQKVRLAQLFATSTSGGSLHS